jgi:glutaminyl-tRNA synthetase
MVSKEADASLAALEAKFRGIGLNDKLVAEAIKSKAVRASLETTIDTAPPFDDPTAAALLYTLASYTQKGTYDTRPNVAKAIVDGRLKTTKQVDGSKPAAKPNIVLTAAAVEYMKAHNSEATWVEYEFENVSGVGVTVTEGELQDAISTYIKTHRDRIVEERYKALPPTLKDLAANPRLKWADAKLRADIVNKEFEQLLGPKDDRDTQPVKKVSHYITLRNDIVGQSQTQDSRDKSRNADGRHSTRHPLDHVHRRLARPSP